MLFKSSRTWLELFYSLKFKENKPTSLVECRAHSSKLFPASSPKCRPVSPIILAWPRLQHRLWPRLGCSWLYDSAQFRTANGAICKERNIMSYHKAQQGLDKPGTSHPSSIPAWWQTSRTRNLVRPLGTQPFFCLDMHKRQPL